MDEQTIVQRISQNCDDLSHAMRLEKESLHKTNQQIADSTGLSISTINKFFAGSLSNPGIFSVAPICIDLGMSLDKLMGIEPPQEDQSLEVERLEMELSHKEEMISEKDKAISRLEERSHMMEKEISTVRENWMGVTYGATGLAILFGIFLMIYVFLDMRNPSLGLFQSGHTAPIVYVATFLIVGIVLFIGHTMVKRRMERKKHADDPN